ncbi:MAG: thiamine-phosphate kinase [Thermogemmata sp.]|nr:thiamine-phosphate kinase [Thermogemmata sp.]
MGGEFDYIAWLRQRTLSDPRVIIGPGDDAAVLHPPPRALLATTDMLMDGVDFHLAEIGGVQAGRKALAANLSDIAAMAGIPYAVLVSLALPRDCPIAGLRPRQLAEQIDEGIRRLAAEFDLPIVGGDTNSWHAPLAISITVLGQASEHGYVSRSGAQPGDWIFVTGPLGGSILGKHLRFTPRIREALALQARVQLHAMCDISDGLAADLFHILEESRCSAVLRGPDIPIAAAARTLSQRSGRSPLEHALHDGEDFELVFTVTEADAQRLLDDPPCPELRPIGVCLAGSPPMLWLEDEHAQRRPLSPQGWTHPL